MNKRIREYSIDYGLEINPIESHDELYDEFNSVKRMLTNGIPAILSQGLVSIFPFADTSISVRV